MAKGPTRKTIVKRKADRAAHDVAIIAELKARALPQHTALAAAAEAYLYEFGGDGYELPDFVDFVATQVQAPRPPLAAHVAVLRAAVTAALAHVENTRIIPGGVRDRLRGTLVDALSSTGSDAFGR